MTPAGVRPEPFSEYTTPEFWDDELQEVAAELEAGGFEGPRFFGDVAGARFDPSASTFAAVARATGETGAARRETPAVG